MAMLTLLRSILLGIVTGVLMMLFYLITDVITGQQLLPLLLNVDFIPIIANASLALQIVLHLFISINISVTLWALDRFKPNLFKTGLITIVVFTLLLYPLLATLSVRPLADPLDFFAFTLWSVGHFLYFYLLVWFLLPNKRTMNNEKEV
ncbi:MAG: hypothetical protein ACRC5C_12190 [Bacilli bacterium]